MLLDETGEYARSLGIRGVPTNVFIDTDGTVTAVGGVEPADLHRHTRDLLGPDGAALIDPETEG